MLKTGFWPGCQGNNFLLVQHAANSLPPDNVTNAVVVLPPFAEEMNKCRHLLTQLMRQLAAAEYDCFLPDHYGTGDSEGDLDSTTVDIWRSDLYQLLQLIAKQGYSSVSFVAVRFGTLQLFDLLQRHSLPLPLKHLVLWQPMFDVAKFWQQFLRIKVAESITLATPLTQAQLEQQLQQGHGFDVAGYPVSPAFFLSVMQMQYQFPPTLQQQTVHWCDTSDNGKLSLATQRKIEQLSPYCQLNVCSVPSAPYWQATELVPAAELIRQTVTLFARAPNDD